jgi:hypothetical protein
MSKSTDKASKLEKTEAKAERKIAALRAKAERKMAKIREEYEEEVAEIRSKLDARRDKVARRAAKAAGAGVAPSGDGPRGRDTKPASDTRGVARRAAEAFLAPGAEKPPRTRPADR